MVELIKVSNQSWPPAVAGAIAGMMREEGYAAVQAVGTGAVNQAIKAITIARAYLRKDGIDLMIVSSFTTVSFENVERTGIHIAIFRRPPTLVAPGEEPAKE